MAFKVMLRRKFFTAISLFGISFTLMVLMIVTAFIDQKIGVNPPEIHRDRTLSINWVLVKSEDGIQRGASYASYYFLNTYVRPLPTPEKVSVFRKIGFVSYIRGKRQKLTCKYTDADYWSIMQFRFLEGGPYRQPEVDRADKVAVISEATRQRYFGNQSALGKKISVAQANYRILGVVENTSPVMESSFSDIWLPVTCDFLKLNTNTLTGGHEALILARSPADFGKINAELESVTRKLHTGDPERPVFEAHATTSLENFSKSAHQPPKVAQMLAIVFTLMVLFMLLPTINLVNINISRMMERASEIGLRKAVGATSLSLVGQFVVENIILTLAGGLTGLLLAVLFLQTFTNGSLHLSWRVFMYGLLLCLFFGVFSGVYPAWRMSRLHAAQALRGGVG